VNALLACRVPEELLEDVGSFGIDPPRRFEHESGEVEVGSDEGLAILSVLLLSIRFARL
jgi:hypothetical protein